jgi:hypothetical protein
MIYLGQQQKKKTYHVCRSRSNYKKIPNLDSEVGRLNYKINSNSEAGWGAAATGLAAYSRVMLAVKLQRITIPGIIKP